MFVRDQTYIARQGWWTILVVFLTATLISYTLEWQWSVPMWLVVILTFYLFRNPNRQIPPAPLGVLSPVDGEVLEIEKIHDPYLNRESIAILLDIARLGPYVLRSVIEGKILERFALNPSQYAIWIQTDEQDDVVIESTMTKPYSRARCYIRTGERVGQGQRCGFLYFRPKMRVLVPANTRVDVKVGDKVKAGSDILATLVRS